MAKVLSSLKIKHYIILLVVFGFLLYLNSLSNSMFWDDDDFILNNVFIRDWRYLPQFFSENLIAGSGLLSNYWRPILLIIFSIEWHLWGSWVVGYHLVNTLFHITNSILLFLLLKKVLGQLGQLEIRSIYISFLTSIFFLIHPLQTEAVTYANSLGDSLSVFFILTGLLSFLKSLEFSISQNRYYFYFAISLVSYCLALGSKETAVIMPGLTALIYLIHKSPPRATVVSVKYIKSFFARVSPFGLIALFYMLLRATALNFNNTFNIYGYDNPYTQSFLIRLFTFFKVILIYFKLMIFPTQLHMERSVPLETSLLSPIVFLGFIFTLSLSLALIYCFYRFFIKKSSRPIFPIIFFGLSWFAIALFPIINLLIPVSGLLYEHWLYLPMVGIFLILSWITVQVYLLIQKHKHRFILIAYYLLLITYLLFLSFQTLNRNRQWANPVEFYKQTLQYSPDSYRLINNLGMEYADVGDLDNAKLAYERAISVGPDNPVAYHNLGNLYRDLNATESAIAAFNTAIANDPNFLYSYRSLATIYFNHKLYREAKQVLTDYLAHNPPAIDILLSLSQISTLTGDTAEAVNYLNQARVLDPQNPLVRNQLFKLQGR